MGGYATVCGPGLRTRTICDVDDKPVGRGGRKQMPWRLADGSVRIVDLCAGCVLRRLEFASDPGLREWAEVQIVRNLETPS